MTSIKEFYRERYKGSLFVVKAGGRVISDVAARRSLLSNIKDLTESGMKVLLIYGGGHAIDAALEEAGIVPEKIEGRRVTSRAAISVIQRVMVEDLGFAVSSTMAELGVNGLNLSNIPLSWGVLDFRARDKEEDYGFDGFFVSVDDAPIRALFESVSFVSCPCLGVSDKGPVNINADNVAVALAEGVHSRKLIFLSDVDGVMKDGAVMPLITDAEIAGLIESGVAEGGMRVKLENCAHALEQGVRRIHLINGFRANGLTDEIYDAVGLGTMVIREVDRARYLNEIERQRDIEKGVQS